MLVPVWKRVLTRQWSFFWAGITFGVAQILYMVTLWADAWAHGKPAQSTPITVTSDLGAMFRGMEFWLTRTLGIGDLQLYGASQDGVASGGAFTPGVGWPIVGMMLGGLLVALVEREGKTWVKYSSRMLVVSFVGGAFFSYGTRLAGGCTLNHLLGGVPMMSIHSTASVAFMALGGFLGFTLMSKLNLASNFKHQETLSYVRGADVGEAPLYDPSYRPFRRPIFWLALAFVALFFGVGTYGGLVNPDSLQHLKDGHLVAFGKSVGGKGWLYVVGTVLAGVIGGFGMAKSGFGTECALVSAEVSGKMTRDDSLFARLGVPRITRTLMRGYLPMIGVTTSWVLMLAFIWSAWAFFGIQPGFEDGIKEQLTLGSALGGLMLGMGAVLLIGCEIRSYMRIGLGYLNTWVGFVGFAVGYLPFTLFYEQHVALLEATRVTTTYKWYQLVFPENPAAQKAMLLAWLVVLTASLVWFVRRGVQNTGMSRGALLHLSTEDVQTGIDAEAGRNGGRVAGVAAPIPVPAPAVGG